MNEIKEKYMKIFGELPPLEMCANYEDEVYIDLMTKAISRGTPVTGDEVAEAFENIPCDIHSLDNTAEEDEARQLFFGKEEVYNG